MEINREIQIAASPETVFSYFIEPEKLLLWMGIEATLEPRPGGFFRVVINQERVMHGEYLELKPFSRLVFSWGWEGRSDVPPGSSKVEVTLTANSAGTLLQLRHYQLSEEAMPLHAKSWDHNLPRLKSTLEKLYSAEEEK
jgi:uncharacterized protein YndB with AHSA1/START domain